jgi:hypothetical protein
MKIWMALVQINCARPWWWLHQTITSGTNSSSRSFQKSIAIVRYREIVLKCARRSEDSILAKKYTECATATDSMNHPIVHPMVIRSLRYIFCDVHKVPKLCCIFAMLCMLQFLIWLRFAFRQEICAKISRNDLKHAGLAIVLPSLIHWSKTQIRRNWGIVNNMLSWNLVICAIKITLQGLV